MAIQSKMKPVQAQPLDKWTLYWRWHREGLSRRVWRSTWPHDMFEILGNEEWDRLVVVCTRFVIILEQVDD